MSQDKTYLEIEAERLWDKYVELHLNCCDALDEAEDANRRAYWEACPYPMDYMTYLSSLYLESLNQNLFNVPAADYTVIEKPTLVGLSKLLGEVKPKST